MSAAISYFIMISRPICRWVTEASFLAGDNFSGRIRRRNCTVSLSEIFVLFAHAHGGFRGAVALAIGDKEQ